MAYGLKASSCHPLKTMKINKTSMNHSSTVLLGTSLKLTFGQGRCLERNWSDVLMEMNDVFFWKSLGKPVIITMIIICIYVALFAGAIQHGGK